MDPNEIDAAAAMDGDDVAFARLMRRHHGSARRLALRMLGGPDEVDDALQEGYTRAYVALRERRYLAQPQGVARWLSAIIARVCLDALRARRRVRARAATEDVQALPAPPAMEQAVMLRVVEARLRALSNEQRSAFVLRELEGWTIRETAQLLGCSDGAVEQRVLRAWAALRGGEHDP